MFAASGTMILLALLWFVLGHMFVSRLRMTRVPAAIAMIGLAIEVVQTARKASMTVKTDQMIWLLVCGGLGVMGLICAIEMFALRRAPADDAEL